MSAWHRAVQAWRDTLRALRGDAGALMLLVLAPVVYAFFYPWPYASQQVTRVPVAVIDQDHTGLSRQLVRWASVHPRLEVRWVGGDERQAQEALMRGEIMGYAVLPVGLKRAVVRREPAVVSVQSHGGYALLNKAVLTGFSEVVGTVSAGIEVRRWQAAGLSSRQAQAARSPIQVQLHPLFNGSEGYGSYVVPAVSLIIIQQTMLMGVGMLLGTWASTSSLALSVSLPHWLGRVLALSLPGWACGLFTMGWVWWWQGYPAGGNPGGALALLAVYVPVLSLWGCVLGWVLADRERVLQLMLFTALPMAFLSGFSWPVEALPVPLQAWRWCIPATPAIEASLRLNQMGATWGDVRLQVQALCLQGLVAGAILWWLSRFRPWPSGGSRG